MELKDKNTKRKELRVFNEIEYVINIDNQKNYRFKPLDINIESILKI